jgi:hypothetical protein
MGFLGDGRYEDGKRPTAVISIIVIPAKAGISPVR